MTTEYQPRYYTVTELTRYLKTEIESNPGLTNIWVKGEIYNLTYHSSGHIYFTLKDENAVLSAVFFKYANKNLKFRLEEGMEILVYGSLTLFEKRGSYQINVLQARPEGTGELQKRIEQLKKKLSEEGLFAPERKRPLPFLPSRIGVATSPTGAAVKDIIKVALRRFSNIEIVVAPAKVQGEGAAETIVRAIEELNRPELKIDVIIAGRGGGSFEDLLPFNEEIVVRAFSDSAVPVISAVGHQIDHPLCDEAADASAPTPSAAAEMAVPVKNDLVDEIRYITGRMNTALAGRFSEKSMQLRNISSKKIFRDPFEILNYREMLLGDAEMRLTAEMKDIISRKKERLLRLPDIRKGELALLTGKKHQFSMKLQALENLSPLGILKRGYSVAAGSDGSIIKSVENVKSGDTVEIRLTDGRINTTVNSVKREV